MPDLPGHDRREHRRLKRALQDDQPGAPPGYLLDEDDTRSHKMIGRVPDERWDPDGDPLARGHGEKDDYGPQTRVDRLPELLQPRRLGVRLVCLHTAEGARSFQDLGGFFASSSAGVSSHVGIDDERGIIGEYVRRDDKAWTQSNYNPQAVSRGAVRRADLEQLRVRRELVQPRNGTARRAARQRR